QRLVADDDALGLRGIGERLGIGVAELLGSFRRHPVSRDERAHDCRRITEAPNDDELLADDAPPERECERVPRVLPAPCGVLAERRDETPRLLLERRELRAVLPPGRQRRRLVPAAAERGEDRVVERRQARVLPEAVPVLRRRAQQVLVRPEVDAALHQHPGHERGPGAVHARDADRRHRLRRLSGCLRTKRKMLRQCQSVRRVKKRWSVTAWWSWITIASGTYQRSHPALRAR